MMLQIANVCTCIWYTYTAYSLCVLQLLPAKGDENKEQYCVSKVACRCIKDIIKLEDRKNIHR